MEFSIKKWLDYRKKASLLADFIQAHKSPILDEKGQVKAYKIQLPKEELHAKISQITSILRECSEYLDCCGMQMKKPLWKFNIDDVTTWKSHKDFAYGDLAN